MVEQEIDRFLEALTSIRAPILEYRRPGLSRSEVDDALAELGWPAGVEVPSEAYAWWGWQDGVESVSGDGYTLQGVLQVAPSPLMLTTLEGLCFRWGRQASEIGFPPPPGPFVPVGDDGPGAALYGLAQDVDDVWRLGYYHTQFCTWRPIGPATSESARPTLTDFVERLATGMIEGRIGVTQAGGIGVLDDSELGLAKFPWW